MKIISSAVKYKDLDNNYYQIVCALRHADAFEWLYNHKVRYDRNDCEAGFMTDTNQFITRSAAARLAVEQKLVPEDTKVLYSEDIWPEEP